MLSSEEINRIREQSTDEDARKLLAEVEELHRSAEKFKTHVNSRLDELEADMLKLEAENVRLIGVKDSVYVERDACVGLFLQLALGHGLKAGKAPGNVAVVDLPTGQVSWDYADSEAYLFSDLPDYPGTVEPLDIREKYQRIMTARFPAE